MKIKKSKLIKKVLSFYKINFNLIEPFNIIIDGNFLYMSIERKIDFKERLEKIFKGSSIILQTSNCILDELEKLGPEFRGIFLRARRFFRLKCHDKPISAYDCIMNQIEQNKERKFIVATQDETLRKSLRKIGGIPIIYIKNDSLQIEEPSIESKKIATNVYNY